MKKPSNINKKLILLLSFLWLIGCQSPQQEHQKKDSTLTAVGYTCPMPEDSVFSNKPGSCPKCGMDLEPMPPHAVLYTCPMPEDSVFSDKAGTCPKCGMDLEPVHQHDTQTNHTPSAPHAQVHNIPIVVPVEKTVETSITAKGYCSYNPQNLVVLSARFDGRIERLYVKYNYQKVGKGQKIMDIYSPELVTAQQNYLSVLGNLAEANLADAALQKLLFLGMDMAQIRQLQLTRQASAVVSIYAPTSGHVHQMDNIADLTNPVDAPPSANSMGATNTLLTWREGMYVKKGDKLFNIINLSSLWAILKIYPQDLDKIRIGQELSLVSELQPNQSLKAKVAFIEPMQEKGTKFTNIRVPFQQSQKTYPIGSLLSASLPYTSKGLWLPISAVQHLGNGNWVVFQKTGTNFEARKVTTGEKLNDEIKILKGLSVNDTVALNSSYLTDSESFITNP